MKVIAAIIAAAFLSISLSGCGDFSCKDIFTLPSVKRVSEKETERLKKKAEEYDRISHESLEAAVKAGGIYQKLGERYLAIKLWDLSIKAFEKSIGHGRNTPIVHYSLGIAYANRGKEMKDSSNIEKAEHHYRHALEIKPGYAEALYALSILLFYIKGDRTEGLKVIERTVSLDRKFYKARFARGRFYYELKKPVRALSIYEELYSDLQGLPKSEEINTYRENCKKNIERLMLELSGKK